MRLKKGSVYRVEAVDHRGHLGSRAGIALPSKPLVIKGGEFVGYVIDQGVRVAMFEHTGAEDDPDVSSYTLFVASAIIKAKELK